MNIQAVSSTFLRFSKVLTRSVIDDAKVLESVVHTNPIALEVLHAPKSLVTDVFQHTNSLYCKMTEAEKAIMPKALHDTKQGKAFAETAEQIRFDKLEESVIYDKNGELIFRTKKGSNIGLDYTPEELETFSKLKDQGLDIGMIHNHPFNQTFSYSDLDQFFAHEQSVMMATTPGGGYAFLQRTKFQGFSNAWAPADLGADLKSLTLLEYLAEIKLVQEGKSNVEFLTEMDKFKDHQLKMLIKRNPEFGFKYEYKPGSMDAKHFEGIDQKQLRELHHASLLKQGLSEEQIAERYKELKSISLDQLKLPELEPVATSNA